MLCRERKLVKRSERLLMMSKKRFVVQLADSWSCSVCGEYNMGTTTKLPCPRAQRRRKVAKTKSLICTEMKTKINLDVPHTPHLRQHQLLPSIKFRPPQIPSPETWAPYRNLTTGNLHRWPNHSACSPLQDLDQRQV